MRFVAKIDYRSIEPKTIAEIEKNANYGYDVRIILDADNQDVLLVVP